MVRKVDGNGARKNRSVPGGIHKRVTVACVLAIAAFLVSLFFAYAARLDWPVAGLLLGVSAAAVGIALCGLDALAIIVVGGALLAFPQILNALGVSGSIAASIGLLCTFFALAEVSKKLKAERP